MSSLPLANIGMDANWTITEELEGDLPSPAAGAAVGGRGPAVLVAVMVVGLVAVLVVRRRKASRAPGEPPAGEQPAVEPERDI